MIEKMITRKHIPSLTFIVAAVIAIAPACMGRSYVLLVEQTPIEGGIIDPGVGVHSFTPGEMVTLTATPRPGYQFVRWMGDVSSADTSSTTVTLDAPKMLVAVFERVEYALLSPTEETIEDEGGGGAGGGSGRLTGQSVARTGGDGISPASGVSDGPSSPIVIPPDDDDDDTDGEIPIPTPEPGTIALMALGARIVLMRRKS